MIRGYRIDDAAIDADDKNGSNMTQAPLALLLPPLPTRAHAVLRAHKDSAPPPGDAMAHRIGGKIAIGGVYFCLRGFSY